MLCAVMCATFKPDSLVKNLQDVYCFMLPFVLKWVLAALLASVLVSLFSRLRRQGDRSHRGILAQVCALVHDWW